MNDDDIAALMGPEPEEAEAEAESTTETEAQTPVAETEAPAEETKVESEPETEQPEKPGTVPVAAIQAERAKTQAARQGEEELRARLAVLEAAIANQTQTKQEQETEAPFDPDEIFTNPKAVLDRLSKAADEKVTAAEQRFRTQLTNMSEANAIARHGQEAYSQSVEAFREAMAANPDLARQAAQQADPAEWVFQQGKLHSDFKEVSADPAAYKEKLRAELLAEITAETEAKAKKLEAIPPAMSQQTTQADLPGDTGGLDIDLSKTLALG